MTEPLSIFAAARDAPARPGLRLAEHTYTFAQLAAMTGERIATLERPPHDRTPYPLVGRNVLETVITLYALLEQHVPALLLHPRLTAPEQNALLQHAARLGSVPVENAAAILHTSGTTGAPRAAILRRSAFVASADASTANLGWQDDDCWLLCMPLAHVGGLSILTRCLMARRCLALLPAFDASRFPELLQRYAVSLVSLVPTMLAQILDARADFARSDRLRAVLLGGAATSTRLLQRARARALPVLVTYGMTETCSQVATTPYALRFDPASSGVGAPLPGVDVRVREGHIEVHGPVLMSGYWGERSLPHDAWFDTGDLGEIDAAGCLHVHARRQDLIVTGGENVYPAEVEHVLETCPGVHGAAVFGVPDEVWGQTVAAALVGDAAVACPSRLAAHVAAQLAPHKRPRRICFVAELPRTRAAKLDRRALITLAPMLKPLPLPHEH